VDGHQMSKINFNDSCLQNKWEEKGKQSSKKMVIWNWIALKLLNTRKNILNFSVRIGMELYVEVLYSSLLNLKHLTSKNDIDTYSNVMAVVSMLV
jgi:hypothetical protein